ncbi:MAG: DUF4115 domain-containing protein, partial [Alphaproteobacteria bacterium]|nr:DUF4115 domain-containing protein [Alphaproteobacteria bacterium]
AGLETKQDFSFPMPLPDRGLPGGALLLVALIVAACAYAVWYYRASGERSRPERVAAVPEQLIPLPPTATTPAPAPEPTAPAASTDTTPAAAAPAAAPAPSTPPAPTTAAASAPQSAPAEASAPRPSAASEPPAAAPSPAPAAPSPPVQTASVAAPAPSEPAVPPTASEVPAVPAAPAAPPAPAAHVYGITSGPVRVIIKAAADSWVQVRDSNQQVLQMRVLKSGDTLRVPDKSGLTLRTGNAGGLEITVDGKPVPAVGPVGKTRTVSLDPEKLVSGTSSVE